ncbi:MAG: ComEC/Rec2 family competence protein, partial [Deltaproteobacteria bacterium]|nr:ComEC/Rec2 family competence protein [Deltaproteobacteria bacterium]
MLLLLWVVETKTDFFKPKPTSDSIIHLLQEGPRSFHCEGKIVERNIVALRRCATGRVELRVKDENFTFHRGDEISFRAFFLRPQRFKNPGSFDIEFFYRRKGVDSLAFVGKGASIRKISSASSGWVFRWLEEKREKLRGAIFREEEKNESGFLLALLLGERSLLSKDISDAFQRSGLTHVLAISGLNVSLVSFLFYFFFRLLVALPPLARSVLLFRIFPLFCVPPLWLYVALADFPVSAVRSAIMSSLFLGALCLWRRLDWISVLALAAVLILLHSPLEMFGPSFQLSFAAVAFLILFFPKWKEGIASIGPKPVQWLLSGFGVTLISLLGVAPLLLWHFHYLSFAGLLANVAAIPFLTFLIQPLATLGWLLTIFFSSDFFSLWEINRWLAGQFL